MAAQTRQERQLLAFGGHHLANAHTVLVYAAFLIALLVGCSLHYDKITRNEWFGYPQEWMPSVSATIGDRYPERALFQILIACCAGPRLATIVLWYLMNRRAGSKLPIWVAAAGLLRCFSGVGWMMITSSDDHDIHDIAMFVFLLATPLWMGGSIALSPPAPSSARKWRKITAAGFFGSLPPMIYLFIQHKVHQIPGAYSRYAYFEWNLILTDIGFDAVNALDLKRLQIRVFDTGDSEAKTATAPPSKTNVQSTTVDALDRITLRDALAFLSDSILGFCFITTMTALGPCIFFFNVYNMGLAGQEALLLVNLSVVFLVYRPLRRFIATYPAFFQLLSLGGLAGYPDDYESHRLGYLAAANAVQMVAYASIWLGDRARPAKLHREGLTLGIGLIATVVAKLANHSLNPAWPFVDKRSGGWNGTVVALGVLACIEKSLRPLPSELPSPLVQNVPGSTARSSIGFGSLLFALHHLFSDGGSIIVRTWTGYPIRGPTSLPFASFAVVGMTLGLATPFSPTFSPLAIIGAWGLYAFDDWLGFAAGLVLAVPLCSALPPFLRSVSSRPQPALAFALAFLTYDLFVLADVWAVAYAFVPGGPYLRERTDLIQIALIVALALGTYEVSLPTFPRVRVPVATKTLTRLTLGVLCTLAAMACGARLQRATVPKPFLPEARILTVGIWTVHFGMDGFMWESQRRIRDLLRDAQLDVVGLLESDLQRIVFGNRDLTQYISEDLGYYADIGPGPNKHTWGAALLSKFPIINSTHHLLPSPKGELAPAIHATLDVYGSYVDVVVAHNGQEEDPLDRQLQSIELGRIMAEAFPRPLIFLGYVVTKPHAPRPAPYHYLVEDGKMLDVDATDTDRWCEYILFRGLRRIAYARITRGSNPSVTDTELQTARFVVPASPIDSANDITNGRQVLPGTFPESWLYDHRFFGRGLRGHRFQVLGNGNQALYYCEEGCKV